MGHRTLLKAIAMSHAKTGTGMYVSQLNLVQLTFHAHRPIDLSQRLDGLFALASEQMSMIEKGTIHFIISFLVFLFSFFLCIFK